jgi:hypothetical protein
VLNFGVSGYGTDQEWLLYQAVGRRYCPDLVLVALYGNDLRENQAAAAPSPKPLFRPAGGTLALTNVPVPRPVPAPAPPPGHARAAEMLAPFVRASLPAEPRRCP